MTVISAVTMQDSLDQNQYICWKVVFWIQNHEGLRRKISPKPEISVSAAGLARFVLWRMILCRY